MQDLFFESAKKGANQEAADWLLFEREIYLPCIEHYVSTRACAIHIITMFQHNVLHQ